MTSLISRLKQNQESQKNGHFDGTFEQYLELLEQHNNPKEIVQSSHQRMFEHITSPGVTRIKTEEVPRLRRIYGNTVINKYKFFEDQFYGMDTTIMKIVRYFRAAANAGEESRQVLYFVGPVGAGKSSLVDLLKKGLEESRPIYALKGCPMHEEPLHLVPKHLRKEFEDALGVHIEGDLCPICRNRLKTEYKGEMSQFPVETVNYSIMGRVGIGVIPPVDPNNQDTSVLTGSVDISKLDLYPEDDPRVMSLNGAFNVGNRGIIEFIEVFKNQPEYLHTMITATQEKVIPSPGKGSMISFDGIIIAHSNEAEWNRFKSDHTNEAIMDRIVKIEVPYSLALDDEVKIYQKLLKRSDFDAHIAPHTIEIASMFAILTRLAPSKLDPLVKLKLYNGENIVEKGTTKKVSVSELKDAAPREGMSGISTRFIMKAIDAALSESEENNCIHPLSVMDALLKAVKELPLSDDDRNRYLAFIQDTLKQELHEILRKEITKAFIHGFKEQAETLFNNYLDHAEAFINSTKIKDSSTGEDLEPDLKFLESIEEQLGISSTAVKGFRQDAVSFMFSILRQGGKLDYRSYGPLKEAIEKKLTASVKELSRIITTEKTRDPEQKKKYNLMVEEMKKNGYCDHCCNVILKYAANNLWKD